VGFYLQLKCESAGCGFSATIGNATEFYIDAEGVERPYGHPTCFGPEAAKAGISGYWRDLLCWECGRVDRESIRLGRPIHQPALAWAMFTPPDLEQHPCMCTACEGILCDTAMLQMFLHYRADPVVVRRDVEQRLGELRERRRAKGEEDDGLDEFEDYLEEIVEREGDPVERMEAELRDLATISTADALILYRLDLVPTLPVTEESLVPLKEKFIAAGEEIQALRADMFAKMEAAAAEEPPVSDGFDWFHSPPMKAKRALDAKIEDLRTLKTHAWVARRLLGDQDGTLAMFRQRCPACRAEKLSIQSYQT
jgi:hypothetical protein